MSRRGRIFVSYRRDDVPGDARSIRDRLARKFGERNVFMDVDNLLAGQRFDRELDKALTQCDVLVAVIGPQWMTLLSDKTSSGERDYVCDEIAAALKRDIVVIPALVGREGHMPSLPRRENLPEDIRDLVQYQKHSIVHESFGRNLDDLIAAIETVGRSGKAPGRWMPLGVAAAVAVVLLALSAFTWRSGILTWLESAPSGEAAMMPGPKALAARNAELAAKQAAELETKKKADEDAKRVAEQAAQKKADDEARRKSEEAVVTDCDRLAASPYDPMRPEGVPAVEREKINVVRAAAACDAAMRQSPTVARFAFLAGRVADTRADYARAAELYREAIAKGSVPAARSLGYLYHFGHGVTKDYAEARKWYEKAMVLGDRTAITNLGSTYDEAGAGGNYAEARKLYERAAALGEPFAMFNLGQHFEYGLGVQANVKTAKEWYTKAADAGFEPAKSKLTVLK